MPLYSPSRHPAALPLNIETLRKGLKTERLGLSFHLFDQIPSTNAAALALADQGAPEGTTVLAEAQTQGRGRWGREWISPAGGNLYLSVILRPQTTPSRTGLLSLAGGLAVARAIEEAVGITPRLKWPNDIRIGSKKVSGLLLEGPIYHGRYSHLVIGIGVNVHLSNADLPEELRAGVTSLVHESGRPVDRVRLTQAVLERLEAEYEAFLKGRTDQILISYSALSETLGRSVRIQEKDGFRTGKVVGFTENGGLMIEEADGRRSPIHSEEVIHVR